MLHAKLSASGSKKWLNCPMSVKLESKIPNTSNCYALEGTVAHELSELKLKLELGFINVEEYDSSISILNIDDEMKEYTDCYVRYVIETFEKYNPKVSKIFLEERVNFDNWVPEGFGTADAVIIKDSILEIIDLKYGKGVKVSANNNSQLMLYALGFFSEYSYLYDIHKIRLTIVQPRLNNISNFEIDIEDLLLFGEDVKLKAIRAFNEEGVCVYGSHCDEGFCRARAICRVYAEQQLKVVKHDCVKPEDLSNSEISEILKQIEPFIKWGKLIKDYALLKAIEGVNFEGFKLSTGRGTRNYSISNETLIEILKKEGYRDEDIFEVSIKSLASIEKLLGKKKFKSVLGEFVYKITGKPILVPNS